VPLKPIDKIALKIERAYKHIRELQVALSTFYKENRDFLRREIDPESGDHIFKIVSVPEVPEMISVIAGDVLQNLRSALDHMTYRIVVVSPLTTSKKDIFFPFGESLNDYMASERRRKVEQASSDAIKRIDALKPYKGGNDRLWQLARLNNVDKHRLLLTTAMRFKDRTTTKFDYWRMRATIGKGGDPGGILQLVTRTNFGGPVEPLKVGDIVHVKPGVVKLKGEMKFAFDVAIDEPKIIECRSLFETLYEMHQLVKGIIPRFADLL